MCVLGTNVCIHRHTQKNATYTSWVNVLSQLAVMNISIARKCFLVFWSQEAISKFSSLNWITSFIISLDLQCLMSKMEVLERELRGKSLRFVSYFEWLKTNLKNNYFWLLFENFQKIWDEWHLKQSLKSICFYTFRIISLFLNILMVDTGQIKAKGTEHLILIKSLVQATPADKSTCF